MNALNMMIFPLVFCSIVMGIASIGSAKTTGKITGAAMLFFLCTTALASFMGLIIPRLIHLGRGVKFEMATSDIQATKMDSILDTVKSLIPSNPVKAFAEGNMLQVLVFSLVIGFTLIAIGEKGEPLLKVIDSLNEVCLKIISTVMYFTPIGVFCTIVPVVEANGTSTIKAGSKKGKAKITITLKSGLKKVVTVTVQKTAVKTKKITGAAKNLKLKRKQKAVLRPVLAPVTSKQKITYKSSNTKVATVNSKGQITAKKKGTAVITVKSGSKTVKCKVTVR